MDLIIDATISRLESKPSNYPIECDDKETQVYDWFNNLTPEQQEQWLRGQEAYQESFKNRQCDDQECPCHESDFEVMP